jgi:DNA-directed RNA polymerase alpha subunit
MTERNLLFSNLSLRAVQALERAGITTLEQVAPLTRSELLEIKGIGEEVAYEVSRTVGRMMDLALAEVRS